MLRVTSLEGNTQLLDGGAMFGSVPRALWSRWATPDELGRIPLAGRSFLVEDGERRIVLEAGVGAFFEPKLQERFGIEPAWHVLSDSMREVGVALEDVDAVVLSHLHFDHVGGLVSAYAEGKPLELVFPRARFVVGKDAWERAKAPHFRDRASYVPEILSLLEQSGRLEVVPEDERYVACLGSRITLRRSDGHTPGMRLAVLHGSAETAVFCGDLIPGSPWVHLPVTAGYDRYPELLIDEKLALYQEYGDGLLLLFCHDESQVAGTLGTDDRGRFGAQRTHSRLLRHELDQPAGASE